MFICLFVDIYAELYAAADRKFHENLFSLLPADCVTRAIHTVCKCMSDTGVMAFSKDDAASFRKDFREISNRGIITMLKIIFVLYLKNAFSPKGSAELATLRCGN